MQNRTALIVDDSRTASQMLRLMLEREEFQVDVLGSAEDALGYLRDHRPGIIFMDHLMPGMDGFQAVKEIKSSSATSTIPIVMYTAKSGDLYVGQAHALGAVDILPKPPTRESLRAVFRRIDERAEAANEVPPEPAPAVEITPVQSALAQTEALVETAESVPIESPPPRAPERAAPTPDFLREAKIEVAPEADTGTRVPWWMALAATVLAFVAGMQFPAGRGGDAAYLDTLSGAVGEGMTYPYGEAPFAGARLEHVRALVKLLAAAGFKGTIKLQGYTGTFCLVADAGSWHVPDPALPIGSCDMLGPSGQEARQISGMQELDFREFLAASPLLRGSGIRVTVEALGDRNPHRAYPEQSQVATAGDWNRIAAENNRIAVVLVPQQ